MTTSFLAVEKWVDAVKIISGGWDGLFNIAGWTVATIQAALADPMGVPATASAFVNGKEVEPSYRLQANDTLEFVMPCGEKGILDPDEKAQLNRIEELVIRLVGDPATPTKNVAARKGSPGRKSETLEVAEYANELRLQKKTWKEIFSACKKRWPGDRRVRNERQVRATWDRHFGDKQNQH